MEAAAEFGIPVLPGNRLEIMDAAEPILRSIIADIDRARHFCHLEFYIWNAGGTADEVCEALMRAATRGVDWARTRSIPGCCGAFAVCRISTVMWS